MSKLACLTCIVYICDCKLFLHPIGPLGPDDHIKVRSVLPASRWFEIGRELGFSCDSLDEIQNDDTIYTRRGYLSCMLRKWLNQELVIGGSPHHTWDVIAHALDSERVGESELAEAVRHNHSMPSRFNLDNMCSCLCMRVCARVHAYLSVS